jgi:hypothetical protein
MSKSRALYDDALTTSARYMRTPLDMSRIRRLRPREKTTFSTRLNSRRPSCMLDRAPATYRDAMVTSASWR